MATTGDGGAIVRPLFVMVGLVERQAMVELTNPGEREIHPIVFGFKFGFEIWVMFGCKESVRKFGEIFFNSHPSIILFYFLDVIVLICGFLNKN